MPGGLGRTLRRAVVAASLAAALAAPATAHAAGVDQTCELTATRFDPDTVNVLFPDSSAQYWSAHYVAVPGTRIRIDGIFPYARYTSWNVYDPILRPFAKKSDFELQPDPGSANPFLPGANRTTPPDFINIKVEELTGDRPFDDLDKYIRQDELRALSDDYKKIAGFGQQDVT